MITYCVCTSLLFIVYTKIPLEGYMLLTSSFSSLSSSAGIIASAKIIISFSLTSNALLASSL